MFSPDKSQNKIGTLIGINCTIDGILKGSGYIKNDGIINGDVLIENDLETSSLSYIKGNISCFNAEVSGKIDGNINCSGKLLIGSTGLVHGDITVKDLIIIQGGILQGKCTMMSDKESSDTTVKDIDIIT
ncbi:MAG: polymer-forming cytoskeletal protein [Bacillota bacterium]|nr:polymer-forming cytoskeletal protein [Bacillota bacterium]